MGTRADFWLGIDPTTMQWLGSIAWDGDELPRYLHKVKSQEGYIKALAKFAKERDDWTDPASGWPWPWTTSHLTDAPWTFHNGRLYKCMGETGNDRPAYMDSEEYWVLPDVDIPDEVQDSTNGFITWLRGQGFERAHFPDMADKQRVTMGKRSGLIVP